ncbi:MAG: ABC transporter ATP-binding protein [Saccharothrix sp.]|nr:ABC transporter ATP-binding protein [Saccharothrix sp.]
MLSIEDVSVDRAGLTIVRGVSLNVHAGEVVALLGANGAGKTTLLEGVSGAVPIARGRIVLDGERVDRVRPWRRSRKGLGHVEQGRAVFAEMSTLDNLRAAAHDVEPVFELFPELRKRVDVPAGLLSGGEQQMVAVGRALLRRPRVVLVDEMSLGLAPVVVRRLARAVRELADSGVGVLLVEQFAALALEIADRAYVMARGEVVSQALDEDHLRALYLGDKSEV